MKKLVRLILVALIAVLFASQDMMAQEVEAPVVDNGETFYFSHYGSDGARYYDSNPVIASKGGSARFNFEQITNGADEVGEEWEITSTELNAINIDSLRWQWSTTVPSGSSVVLNGSSIGIASVTNRLTFDAVGDYRYRMDGTDPLNQDGATRAKLAIKSVGSPPSNNPPTSQSFTSQVTAGASECIDVFARSNAHDVDGDTLVLIVSQRSGDIIPDPNENDGDKDYCFSTPSGFSGSLAVDFQVSDGTALSSVFTMTVVVNLGIVFVLGITEFTSNKSQVGQSGSVQLTYTVTNADEIFGNGGPSNWDNFHITSTGQDTVSETVVVGPFSTVGIHTLELRAVRGIDEVTRTLQIEVLPPTPSIVVNAGTDQSITLPVNTIQLNGSISADNISGAITTSWSKISGPVATIASASSLGTEVTITDAGHYTFELCASAGGFSECDTLSVIVNSAPVNNQPPYFDLAAWDDSAVEGQNWVVTGRYLDPEGDNVRCSTANQTPSGVRFSPSGFVSSGTEVQLMWDNPIPGTHSISWRCEDDRGALGSVQSMQIVVQMNTFVNLDVTIDVNGDISIVWTSHNVVQCTGSGNLPGWSGSYNASGNEHFDPSHSGTFWFEMTCQTTSGDIVISNRVTVSIPTSTDTEDETLPEEFTLLGNYPNPFNPSTTITFNLPETADVQVTVTDLIGRRVMDTPSQTLTAGSNRNIQMQAGGLPSGIYVYRVVAYGASTTYVKSGTMTLIR